MDARIKENGIDAVLEGIARVSESDFLCGGNKSGWQATFDWFIAPSNFQKVLEGNYANKRPNGKGNTNPSMELGAAEIEAIQRVLSDGDEIQVNENDSKWDYV